MIKFDIEQRSEAWYAIKCGRVTGTRFSALVAKETTKTYKDLVADITTEIITGRMEETYSNEIMERGIETEPYARREYENIFDVKVEQCGFIIPDEDGKYHEWIGISPDGLIENGLLEIKCPLMKTHLNYISSGKLPAEYRYQVQGQLFVTGLEFCDFMSHVEGMKPFIIRVEPDKELHSEFDIRLDVLIEEVIQLKSIYEKYNYFTHQP